MRGCLNSGANAGAGSAALPEPARALYALDSASDSAARVGVCFRHALLKGQARGHYAVKVLGTYPDRV